MFTKFYSQDSSTDSQQIFLTKQKGSILE